MKRTRLHLFFTFVFGGLLALALLSSPGCGFIIKQAAGMAVKKMAKDQYEHYKESREQKARAKERQKRATQHHDEEQSE